jgi:hypothetical protein
MTNSVVPFMSFYLVQGDVETTVRGCPVTAVDFCPVSCLLAIGDQLGRVKIVAH